MSAAPAPDALFAKVRGRLIPFLFVLYIVAYIDRINVGFAALQMNAALGFSASTYGLGAGMFFLSYLIFEIPSNVILVRVGARRWFARIMITWGLVASAMMFVHTAHQFYTARFLLGAAEAGFFPGIIFYLTRWFPVRERAQTIAAFMTASVVAGIVGGPISGALLSLDTAGGLAGWQWLYLLEGLPAILLGGAVLFILPEGPADAAWLTPAERDAVAVALAGDRTVYPDRTRTFLDFVKNGQVWLLAALYFTIPVATYGVGFWLPQIIKTASGASNFRVGLLTAIPYIVGAIGMVLNGRHSDRTGERRWHIAVPAFISGTALIASTLVHGLVPSLIVLSMATLGANSMLGPFWTLSTSVLAGAGAATGIAFINSVGNIGGFVGPYLMGYVRDATHSFSAGLIVIGAMAICGGAIALIVRTNSAPVQDGGGSMG